jgi:hypothetical protein
MAVVMVLRMFFGYNNKDHGLPVVKKNVLPVYHTIGQRFMSSMLILELTMMPVPLSFPDAGLIQPGSLVTDNDSALPGRKNTTGISHRRAPTLIRPVNFRA